MRESTEISGLENASVIVASHVLVAQGGGGIIRVLPKIPRTTFSHHDAPRPCSFMTFIHDSFPVVSCRRQQHQNLKLAPPSVAGAAAAGSMHHLHHHHSHHHLHQFGGHQVTVELSTVYIHYGVCTICCLDRACYIQVRISCLLFLL